MEFADLREELKCSICLNLYTEPISLRCGHIFCKLCIASALDNQEEVGVYSCPECRKEYVECPVLEKNRKLCNIVEIFQSIQRKQEKQEIFCTYCTESSVPAFKTCVSCETSMCEVHLLAHVKSKSVDHLLTEPTALSADRKCSVHKKILEYYCTMDGTCICMSCWVAGAHRGHQVELPLEASEKKKTILRNTAEKLISEREETKRRIQNLQIHMAEETRKAAVVTERFIESFRVIGKKFDDVKSGVLTEISRQVEQISQSVAKLIQHLETQKDGLSRRITQLKDLCDIQDPIIVLRKDPGSDHSIQNSGDIASDIKEVGSLDEAIISLLLHRGLLHLTKSVMKPGLQRKFPVMKKSDIFLDINTANNFLIISQDLKSVTHTEVSQNRPDGPERFAETLQVLSTCSFSSGKHYWEVNVNGRKDWLVGVVGQSIERKEEETASGVCCSNKFWSLYLADQLVVAHRNMHKELTLHAPVRVVGVYLDYDSGHLSFYQQSDSIRHLHTFTTTFTEPLYATFSVQNNSSLRIIN
ncbi:E3 ubiquitin-protein ligase TRIM39-like [Aquarana catesbeiana]|uniref:E3 ubiquitin-protein ligase TRIM39-like n=1 Tax=Aquarana catesbeiana TaxID=8400 RepID=UPI003CC9742D